MNLSKDKTGILIINYYSYRAEENEDTDQRIVSYLKGKAKKIIHVTHPFPESDSHYSYLTYYKYGEKIKQLKIYILKGPFWFQYLYHILITYYCLFKFGFVFDLCIACANLSFVSIYPLKILFIKRLVYYSVDFVPRRFSNSFLNNLYHLMDKFACKYSDNNWMMTGEQITGRKQFGITSTNSAPFSIVPIGYDIKKINILPIEKIDFYNILYMGAIRESMGPQLTIQTMPMLIKKIPKIHLTIIGTGKYLDYLKELVKKLNLDSYVDFTGYIESFKQMTNLMAQKSIGLAPYVPTKGSFSYYSDPSKIKLYFCCGLPVITTNVVTMSNLISKTKSGIIINYSQKDLAQAIAYLLGNKNRYKLFKDAAIKLSQKFDINHILDKAFKKIPDMIKTKPII